MATYRKTALIKAEQFWPDATPWPAGVVLRPDGMTWFIETLEGSMCVSVGDWIATGVNGERWPIKEDVFEATYELAEN